MGCRLQMQPTDRAYGLITAEIDLCNSPITPGAKKGFFLNPESIEKALRASRKGLLTSSKTPWMGVLRSSAGHYVHPAHRHVNPPGSKREHWHPHEQLGTSRGAGNSCSEIPAGPPAG